jgi:DNA invertase Pin-like site-specific DNA recombinase
MKAPRRALDALPSLLAEIAEVAGEALGSPEAGVRAALAVARAKGGQKLYVSPDPARSAWLTEAVGPAAAAAIVSLYASSEIEVPLGEAGGRQAQKRRRRAVIAAGLAGGLTINEIAREADCSRRFVFWTQARLKGAGAGADARQLSLFGDEAA